MWRARGLWQTAVGLDEPSSVDVALWREKKVLRAVMLELELEELQQLSSITVGKLGKEPGLRCSLRVQSVKEHHL